MNSEANRNDHDESGTNRSTGHRPGECPDYSTLENLLVEDASPWLSNHLTECESCRVLLDSIAGGTFELPERSENLAKRLRDPHFQNQLSSAVVGSLIGHYLLLRIIGKGGMGLVYEGLDTRLDRHIAVKTIRPDSLVPELIRRIGREARLQSSLNHPNIVTLHEFGIHDGLPYLVMELVPGETLKKLIQNWGPLPPKVAARIVQDLARAISYAHGKGVIHRDLKTSNVLLPSESSQLEVHEDVSKLEDPNRKFEPKLTDFGLSVSMISRADHSSSDAMPGTLAYMSPEQLDSSSPGVSPSSDIYALGVILYECLTGRAPFMSGNPALTIRMILQDSPTSPGALVRGIPRDLETICLKCLEKQPSRRYASAECLAGDLKRYLEMRPIQARPAGAISRTWRTCRRHPLTATALATAAVSLVTLAAVSVIYAGNQAELRRVATAEASRSKLAEKSARASELIAREAESKAHKAAVEAQLESDHARNNLLMGVNALASLRDKIHSYDQRPPSLAETRKLQAEAKKAIETVLLRYINRSNVMGEPSADVIDRLVRDGTALRDFGDKEKSLEVLERVSNLAKKCPTGHPDLVRRRSAAIRSEVLTASMLQEQGLYRQALDKIREAWQSLVICPNAPGIRPGMIQERQLLGEIYAKMLREKGSKAEADAVDAKIRKLNANGNSLAVQPHRSG